MRLIISAFVVAVAVLQEGHCQQFRLGRCPNVTAEDDFDLDSYLGTWYQWGSIGTKFYQGSGRCVKAQYTKNDVTGKIEVVNSQIPLKRSGLTEVKGTLMLRTPTEKSGKFLVTLTVPVAGKVTAPLWVLGTDYKDLSVAYSCLDLWFFHFRSLWILTRDRFPEKNVQDKVSTVLQKIHEDISHFKKTDQAGCETGTS